MRKHCKRKVRSATAPTLVALHISPEAGLSEYTSLLGIEQGWAGPKQFNTLLDCADLLMIAADYKHDKAGEDVAQLGRMALENISGRYAERKKLGASGEELKALRCLVDFSEDWWKRKSGSLFAQSYRALDRYRDYQKSQAQGAAVAD